MPFSSPFTLFVRKMPATDEASKPTLYEESSQYRHWRFSPEQIQRIRQSSNDAAVERVREEWVRRCLALFLAFPCALDICIKT